MTKIGVLSDTHGFVDPKVLEFFAECDQIWHAGDIGNEETANKLEQFKPLKAVFGNIDGTDLRMRFKLREFFTCEDVSVLITHIGGYPGHYEHGIPAILSELKPKIFVCGHSHILKVIPDKKYNLLHLNPGAAGNSGFHHVKTALRFKIEGENIKEMEVLEVPRR